MGKRHKIKKAFNRLSDDEKRGVLHRKTGGFFDASNHFTFSHQWTPSYRSLILSIAKQWEQDTRITDVLDNMLPEIYSIVTEPTLLERVVDLQAEKIGTTDCLE